MCNFNGISSFSLHLALVPGLINLVQFNLVLCLVLWTSPQNQSVKTALEFPTFSCHNSGKKLQEVPGLFSLSGYCTVKKSKLKTTQCFSDPDTSMIYTQTQQDTSQYLGNLIPLSGLTSWILLQTVTIFYFRFVVCKFSQDCGERIIRTSKWCLIKL